MVLRPDSGDPVEVVLMVGFVLGGLFFGGSGWLFGGCSGGGRVRAACSLAGFWVKSPTRHTPPPPNPQNNK